MKSIFLLFLFTCALPQAANPSREEDRRESASSKTMRFYDHLSKKELKDRMKYISRSLGVKCKFCHLKDKKISLSDKITIPSHRKILKRKEIASSMIEMVETMNSTFLNWKHSSGRKADQIDCHFCHRGNPDHLLESVPIPGKP